MVYVNFFLEKNYQKICDLLCNTLKFKIYGHKLLIIQVIINYKENIDFKTQFMAAKIHALICKELKISFPPSFSLSLKIVLYRSLSHLFQWYYFAEWFNDSSQREGERKTRCRLITAKERDPEEAFTYILVYISMSDIQWNIYKLDDQQIKSKKASPVKKGGKIINTSCFT